MAIIIDLDCDIYSSSVTNTVEEISKNLDTNKILYQGSDKVWFYWNKQYVPIIENNERVINNKEKAIKTLKDLFHSKKVD